MPYISPDSRVKLDRLVMLADKGEVNLSTTTVGQLNYLITRLIMVFLKDMSYSRANDVIGVLEAVKLEFYRRALAPYEDAKISENGDVTEYEEI